MATVIGRSFGENDGYTISAETVRAIEEKQGAAMHGKRESARAAAEVI